MQKIERGQTLDLNGFRVKLVVERSNNAEFQVIFSGIPHTYRVNVPGRIIMKYSTAKGSPVKTLSCGFKDGKVTVEVV